MAEFHQTRKLFYRGGISERTLIMNECLLLISIPVMYGALLLTYRLFGTKGLTPFLVFATVLANIEVLILVKAFGIEMTLGNILFATTFVVTDILSENVGKQAAKQAVNIGIFLSILFVVVSQSWFLYMPSVNDWASTSIRTLFANTPRLILVSMAVYALVQRFDVWLYHTIWSATEKKYGDRRKGLWLRNNAATMASQLLNAVLYNIGAFWGIYSTETLMQIIISTFAIYVVTSLCDTPVVYLARRMREKGMIPN